ncbi:hypothetical protein [Nocardia sp. NPDC049526]|uniref:hypothetical protein n=1 Tax=Nocardia sp. NPDC049526 TaxID=3364316 RepID=UPI0037912E1F
MDPNIVSVLPSTVATSRSKGLEATTSHTPDVPGRAVFPPAQARRLHHGYVQ